MAGGKRQRKSTDGHISWFVSFLMFIYYFEREREHMREQGKDREKEGERERIPSSLCAVSTEPNARLEPTSRDIMT